VCQLTDGVLLALAAQGRLKSLTARRCEQLTNTGITITQCRLSLT